MFVVYKIEHSNHAFAVVYCSKSEKGDKELMVKEALANTKLWEARLVCKIQVCMY